MFRAISAATVKQLNIQFGHLDNVANETLVRVGSILESEMEVSEPPVLNCADVGLPMHPKIPHLLKCFRCGIVGHIRRFCKVNLTKKKSSKRISIVPKILPSQKIKSNGLVKNNPKASCKPNQCSSTKKDQGAEVFHFSNSKQISNQKILSLNTSRDLEESLVSKSDLENLASSSVFIGDNFSDRDLVNKSLGSQSSTVQNTLNVHKDCFSSLENGMDFAKGNTVNTGIFIGNGLVPDSELLTGSGDQTHYPNHCHDSSMEKSANILVWDVASDDGHLNAMNDLALNGSFSAKLDLTDLFESKMLGMDSGLCVPDSTTRFDLDVDPVCKPQSEFPSFSELIGSWFKGALCMAYKLLVPCF